MAGPVNQVINHYVTFYGFPDNDPPGRVIAYPKSSYPPPSITKMEELGYADPITVATSPEEWPIGTRMYLPLIQKYLIMEDLCASCHSEWQSSRKYHIDPWMNSASRNEGKLYRCQEAWTRDSVPVEINPPRGRQVNLTPLFDPAAGNGD